MTVGSGMAAEGISFGAFGATRSGATLMARSRPKAPPEFRPKMSATLLRPILPPRPQLESLYLLLLLLQSCRAAQFCRETLLQRAAVAIRCQVSCSNRVRFRKCV